MESLNFILIPVLTWFNDGARVLSDVAGSLILSSDNPLDLHAEI